MQEKNHSLPLGICHRLFNFINNSLIASGLKRVTLGHPLPQAGSIDVPVYHVASMEEQPLLKATQPNDLNSKIPIQFKETDELETWTPVDKLGFSVYISEKDTGTQAQVMNSKKKNQARGNITEPPSKEVPLVEAQIQDRNGSQIQVDIESKRDPQKSASMKDVAEEETRKQKGKKIASENLTLAVEPEATHLKPPPTYVGPRFSVMAGINEQSDAFIKSRKEAMKRNYSLEPRNS